MAATSPAVPSRSGWERQDRPEIRAWYLPLDQDWREEPRVNFNTTGSKAAIKTEDVIVTGVGLTLTLNLVSSVSSNRRGVRLYRQHV